MAEAAAAAAATGPDAVAALLRGSMWAPATIRGNERKARHLRRLMDLAGLPAGALGDEELTAVIGAWLQPKLARFFDPDDDAFRVIPIAAPETVSNYVRAWVAYARRSAWSVSVSPRVASNLSRAVARINLFLGAAYPASLVAASAPKQPGLRAEDVSCMEAVAASPERRFVCDLVLVSRCLLLRPGEIVELQPEWLHPGRCSTAQGSRFLKVSIPRLKTAAALSLPRPSLLYGPAIGAFRRVAASLRRAGATTVAKVLSPDARGDRHRRAMASFSERLRELASAAGVDVRRANAYAMRHGGAEALIDRPAWVAEIQGAWARGSHALAKHYQTGQLEIFARALVDPVQQAGATAGPTARGARRDLIRGGHA